MKLQVKYEQSRIKEGSTMEETPVITLEVTDNTGYMYFSPEYNTYKDLVDGKGNRYCLQTSECISTKVEELIQIREDFGDKRDSISIKVDIYDENVININNFINDIKEKIAKEHRKFKEKNKVAREILGKCKYNDRNQFGTYEKYAYNETLEQFEAEE